MSAGPLTYLGSRYVTDVPAEARIVIAGLPLDAGQHNARVGARLGPRAVREQSALLGAFDPDSDIDVIRALNVVDIGDLSLSHADLAAAQQAIAEFVGSIAAAGAVPVTIGGDGTVTLPQLQALSNRFPNLAVVHMDAHTDAYVLKGDAGPVAFTRAAERGFVDVSHSWHIGLRGPVGQGGLYALARQLGYRLVTMDEVERRGVDDIVAEVRAALAGRPVYICWDMDVFDPSVAPGAFTPSWGGLTSREGLLAARLLSELDIVAIDVNTVSPLHDPGGITAFLAARLIFEFLAGFARKASR